MHPSCIWWLAGIVLLFVLLRWSEMKMGGEGLAAYPLNKLEVNPPDLEVSAGGAGLRMDRGAMRSSSCRHGGGREGDEFFVSVKLEAAALREVGAQVLTCASEAGFCGGVHQQRPLFADAIHGQGRPSALGCLSSPGCFFLNWKILDLGVGINAGFTPSGFVPGGVAGAQALRSSARSGEDEALDCFSVYLFEGLFAKCKDQFVISLILRIPPVIVISPL